MVIEPRRSRDKRWKDLGANSISEKSRVTKVGGPRSRTCAGREGASCVEAEERPGLFDRGRWSGRDPSRTSIRTS